MTSFLTHGTRVHDARLPLRRRHSALRTCITLFAPYGFRATYHHLTLSVAIPGQLEADPGALPARVRRPGRSSNTGATAPPPSLRLSTSVVVRCSPR